jgi:hypothetical protein
MQTETDSEESEPNTIRGMLTALVDAGWTPKTLSVALGGYPSQRTLSRYLTGESDPTPYYEERVRSFYIDLRSGPPLTSPPTQG